MARSRVRFVDSIKANNDKHGRAKSSLLITKGGAGGGGGGQPAKYILTENSVIINTESSDRLITEANNP